MERLSSFEGLEPGDLLAYWPEDRDRGKNYLRIYLGRDSEGWPVVFRPVKNDVFVIDATAEIMNVTVRDYLLILRVSMT